MPNVLIKLFKSLFREPVSDAGDSGFDESRMPEVCLLPSTDELLKQSLMEPRKIEKRLFRIGRRPSSNVHYPQADPLELLIFERPAYTISKLHCQIEISQNEVILRDVGSRTGTKLGGKRLISSSRASTSIVVPKGSHELILGHRDGPYRFQLVVS